jgi:integrase
MAPSESCSVGAPGRLRRSGTAGARLVPLAADRRRFCDRAALAAGVAAPSWERSYKLVAAGRSPNPGRRHRGHSLRGLQATLALHAGATGPLVAQALGHGSFQVTARHYATFERVAAARAARVAEVLGPRDDVDSRLLAGLTPAQR